MKPQYRSGAFVLIALGLAALNFGSLRAMVELSTRDATSSHYVLVPFVSAVLIWQQRDVIFGRELTSAWVPGAILLACGLVVSVRAGHSLSSVIAATVLSCAGGFLLCFGASAFRAALFPMLFLVFMIPVPDHIIAGVTYFLKASSTELVAILFTLTGTPYHREGFVFSLPTFVIEVADECSGIRSSIALLLTTLIAGHMFLTTWWKKALLTLFVIPLAIVKNGVRIVTLSLLAEHVDPGYLTGQLHHEGGIVFFLMTLALASPVFFLLQRSDLKQASGAVSP